MAGSSIDETPIWPLRLIRSMDTLWPYFKMQPEICTVCGFLIYRIYLYKRPGGDAFFKRGGGGERLLPIKKINSRVQWQWAIMDTYSLDLACQHV